MCSSGSANTTSTMAMRHGGGTMFTTLAERYPNGPLADDALFWAGRAAAEKRDYLRAIEHYNELAKKYTNSPKLAETRFAQGDALSELGRFAGAILHFEEIIKKFPNSYLVDPAWGRKGDCQFTLGKDDPARYQEAIASYQTVDGQSAFVEGSCLAGGIQDRPM